MRMNALLRRTLLVTTAWLASLVLIGATAGAAPDEQPTGPVPGRYIVKLTEKARPTLIQAALGKSAKFGPIAATEWREDVKGAERFERFYLFSSADSMLTEDQVIRLLGNGNVAAIEPDYYLELFEYPSDPLFDKEWYLENTGQDYYGVLRRPGGYNDSQIVKHGIEGNDIDITGFYLSPPAETTKVVIAVVDTGVDVLHPELEGRIWHNLDEIAGNGIDDDHNGYIDDTIGYDLSGDSLDLMNFIPDNDPTDDHGHGTHIAGTIAARNDGVGVVGVAPWCEIMPVKIFPNGTTAIGTAGLIYAVNAGAKVVNLSWGSPFESLILREAIAFARDNGVLVAVAAGNSGDNSRSYPAAFDSSFTVGAGNSSGYMTGFSTWGPFVDIVAPGEDILALRAAGTDMYDLEGDEPDVHIVDSIYYLSDGTSMASPIVAGAAALLWSFRPDLSLEEMENVLRAGARDMIDPRNIGDTLIGPDTLSGAGYLQVGQSYSLLLGGGAHIVSPVRQMRYLDSVAVKIAPTAGYSGGFQLDYAVGRDSLWQPLASDTQFPPDSLAVWFAPPGVNGHIRLRLTDDNDHVQMVPFTFVQEDALVIRTPVESEEVKFDLKMRGDVFGADFDSLGIFYRNGGPDEHITTVTTETFDSVIYHWNVSGLEPGSYDLIFRAHFGLELRDTTIGIQLLSSFTAGWPQPLSGRANLSAVCADLNHDGMKEIIVGTLFGLNVFTADGQPAPGFPVLPEMDMRSTPAVYDIDRDGDDEIICTNENGLHAFNYDGTYAEGFPVTLPLQILSWGFPQPTITKLGAAEDSAIVIIGADGRVYAYEFNGDSYFYSLEGWYGTFTPNVAGPYYYGGNAVASTDLTGDGRIEVVVSYSARAPYSGIGLFDGRTGQPAFDRPSAEIVPSPNIHGMFLADLDADSLPEIVASGEDSLGIPTIWIKTMGTADFPGWPRSIPETEGWLSSYPTAADLDLDGEPELLFTWFGFDISSLYVFHADGTPYMDRPGRPEGEVAQVVGTLSGPIVANLTGDEHPEIVLRSGFIMPNTGPERLHLFTYEGEPVPGWPVATPTRNETVFSTPFSPLVDDIDSDGLVELVLIGEANDVYIWDFPASSNEGSNKARVFMDNANSSYYRPRVAPGAAVPWHSAGDDSGEVRR